MDDRTGRLVAELGSLDEVAAQNDFLTRFPDLVDEELVKTLADTVRSAVRVDVRNALLLAEAALAIARKLRSDQSVALALRAKANAKWFMGDCKSAVGLFHEAATLFERAGILSEYARTLSSSIQSLALLGEYDDAFAAAEKAKEIFGALGESWRLARVDINVANIYHRQNRYVEALAAYERAYRELLPYRDMEGIGVALHNMAVCLIALDDFPGALAAYQQVREFCEQQDMPLLVSQADYNIAFLYYLRGDYTRALELLRSTRETCRKNGDTYHLALCDLDQSEIYLELSLVEEAKEMATASLQNFEELGMKYEAVRALTNLAISASLQGDRRRALDLFDQAKEIALGENNRAWPHLIDLYSAIVLLEQNEFEEARHLCLAAADFFPSAQMPSKYALCLLLLTRIALHTGEAHRAADLCRQALEVLGNLDAPILSYQAQFLKGQAHETLGEPDQAYHAYQLSKASLETLRSSLQREELKIGFMRNRFEVYGRLIQLCLDRDATEASAEEAISYVEAAKSRTLRDLIFGGSQSNQVSDEDDADRSVSHLRKELNWFYHRIEREQLSQEGALPQNLESLKREARTREQQLLRLLLEAPASANVGAALRNSSTASLEEIRGALGSNAALLEYFAVGEQVSVALVTRKTVRIIPLTASNRLEQRLRLLQFQLSKFRLSSEYVERFRETLVAGTQRHLQSLYQDLFEPLESLLSAQDLVIVPFGALHSLPFHALFDGRTYLIDRFTVCYQPSASIFTRCQEQSESRVGPSLVLGVDDERAPLIREEARAVASALLDARLLVGADATEQALREFGRTSRLIHIASHGYFRQDSPMFSSIKLADSYVTLYDLYHMNLPVDLLTLSGCVTGMNAVADGDELLGLTRGLLYAGARSLLLSLWEVDDRSTSEFMKKFYCRLRGQARKADCLRAAMLELRDSYPHPYYWAPFKLIGKTLA